MSSDRFPYDMPPRAALIRLIEETYPNHQLVSDYLNIGEPFFAPTATTPGRTFIEVEDTDYNVKRWYVYRRLDLAIALGEQPHIQLTTAISPQAIVDEINRSRGMTLTADDVPYHSRPLVPVGESVIYRLRALPTSLVWYGEVLVDVTYVGPPPTPQRQLESGELRTLEDGTVRTLEQ